MKNVIKYCAILFALLLAGSIITGCVQTGMLVVRAIADKSVGEIKIDGKVVFDVDDLIGENTIETTDEGFRLFGIQFGGTREVKSGTFEITEPVQEIWVDGVNGELEIKRGDAFLVTYEDIPVDYTMEVKDGKLTLHDESKGVFVVNFEMEKPYLCLTIPEGMEFTKLTVNNGSGKISVSDVVAESFLLDGGSGSMSAENIIADKIIIEGASGSTKLANVTAEETRLDMGSGALHVSYSVLGDSRVDSGSGSCNFETVQATNLTVDSGSGRVVYQGELTGNCIFDSGSGSVRLDIEGSKSDYNIRAELGSGGFYVNGNKVSSGKYVYSNGTAENTLVFNTGSGRVSVNFSE